MPRRPRRTSRLHPQKQSLSAQIVPTLWPSSPTSKDAHNPKPVSDDSDTGGGEESSTRVQDFSNDESTQEEGIGNEHDDLDVPRVAQWLDDHELEMEVDGEDEEQNDGKLGRSSELKFLRNDLSTLPLGTLRRARHALTHAKVDSDSESDASESDAPDQPDDGPILKGKEKNKAEWSIKPRSDIAKRSNKHAPMEVTSKRPVTRRRTVVEVKAALPRDPRFLPVAGEFSTQKFQEQYGFLADAHKTELITLRENLKRARKLLLSSPRELQAGRERDVNSLELAVKRAESMVDKDRREKVEQEALSEMAKEEKDRRKQGKGGWWMKDSDKKRLLVRARYAALAVHGGDRAVKKAIERKQKKIGQKEKKSRPFATGRPAAVGDELLRKSFGSSAEGERRFGRRRVG